MVTISPEAHTIIRERARPVFLELPRLIRSCCFDFQECPSVRLGEPDDVEQYERSSVDGTVVFVPRHLPEDLALKITVSRFLGLRRLVVEGWRYL